MKKINYFSLTVIALLIAACGNNEQEKKIAVRKDALDQIKKVEGDMHQSVELNPQIAVTAIKAYSDFVTQFPGDSLNADFVFKSAEISTAIKKYDDAYADYQEIEKDYPKYKLLEECIYLQAYLLDNFMNQDGKAKMVYEHLMEKYPNGRYTKDAQAAIENLGKSDEDLIKEFKKKNGEK